MTSLTPDVVATFWGRVDSSNGPDSCWRWSAGKCEGYGVIRFRGVTYRAHRVAWELTYGNIPAGLVVCHRCDNPPCCNPAHLFLGTVADNNRDTHEKGRNRQPRGDRNGSRLYPDRRPRGENHKSAKLTANDVRAIRASALSGKPASYLVSEFGVSRRQIDRIVRRQTWRCVP